MVVGASQSGCGRRRQATDAFIPVETDRGETLIILSPSWRSPGHGAKFELLRLDFRSGSKLPLMFGNFSLSLSLVE